MPRLPYRLIASTACAIAVGAAGCGGGTHQTASDHRAKPILLTQASLGYGAFYRFVWAPARAGDFSDPGSLAVTRAVAATRFSSHQLRVAAHQLRDDKRLGVLFAPLELTADKIRALGGAIPRHPSVAQVEAIDKILRRIAAAAKHNGARIANASAAEVAAAGGPHA